MKKFWQERSEREKKILLFLGGFVLFASLYAFLWQPGDEARKKLRSNLPRMRAQLQEMREEQKEIEKLKKSLTLSRPGDMKTQIESSAASHQINIAKLDILGDGRAHLSIAAMPFDAWISWLEDLRQQNHLILESGKIEGLAEPGMVKIESVLNTAGGN